MILTTLAEVEDLVVADGLDRDAVSLIVSEALGEDLGGRGVLPPGTGAAIDVTSARLREESRGAHWRDDFEGRRDAWHGHLLVETDRDHGVRHTFVPAESVGTVGSVGR